MTDHEEKQLKESIDGLTESFSDVANALNTSNEQKGNEISIEKIVGSVVMLVLLSVFVWVGSTLNSLGSQVIRLEAAAVIFRTWWNLFEFRT